MGWGTGAIGLTYTAPRKTLRITGAKPTRYSVYKPYPPVQWGNVADATFLRADHCDGFGEEKAPPHVVYDRIRVSRNATTAFAARMLRHYNPTIRIWAAQLLAGRADAASIDALVAATAHSDPRVRHAALAGVGGYNSFGRSFRPGRIPPPVVSARFGKVIAKVLSDPASAWWEIDGALWALRNAAPATIRKHMPDIVKFAKHEEWWLREAALMAISGLGEHVNVDELVLMARMYADERHVFFRGTFYMVFKHLFGSLKIQLPPAERARFVAVLSETLHTMKTGEGYGVNARHEAAHRTMMIFGKGLGGKDYPLIRDDIVKYLQMWIPNTQHSAWMITGNGWQPGIVKIAEDLGPEGLAIRKELRKCLDDRLTEPLSRDGRRAREALEKAFAKQPGK